MSRRLILMAARTAGFVSWSVFIVLPRARRRCAARDMIGPAEVSVMIRAQSKRYFFKEIDSPVGRLKLVAHDTGLADRKSVV